MQAYGYGGRAGNHQNETLEVLAGLLPNKWSFEAWLHYDHYGVELLSVKNCASPKCGRMFRPRADGDDYCNERCDPLNRLGGREKNDED